MCWEAWPFRGIHHAQRSECRVLVYSSREETDTEQGQAAGGRNCSEKVSIRFWAAVRGKKEHTVVTEPCSTPSESFPLLSYNIAICSTALAWSAC